MNRKQVVAAAVAVLSASVACAAVTIDPAKSCILVPARADVWAATELQTHVKLISGVEVPIVTRAMDVPKDRTYLFNVGILPEGQTVQELKPEECRWRVTDSAAWFWGNAGFANKEQRAKFAVIDFLENSLNVRWPCEEYIIYDATPGKIVVGKTEGAWAPTVKLRSMRGSNRRTEKMYEQFTMRMRQGGHVSLNVGHAWVRYWNRFGKEHPDWFAMNEKGDRVPRGVLPEKLMNDPAVYNMNVWNLIGMCVSNEGFQEQIVKDWIEDGKKEYINLCANDIPGSEECHCEKCKALDVVPEKVDSDWITFLSDRYMYLANRVLEKVRKIRPDAKVCFYVYNATQDPPRREKLSDGCVAGLVPVNFTYDKLRAFIRGWKAAGLKDFYYRPNQHHYFQCYYLPLGHEEHFHNVMKILLEEGAFGFDFDCPKSTPRVPAGIDWFERYVAFHTMQDTSKPFEYWEDHYFQSYGPAKEEAKAYARFWRAHWNRMIEPNIEKLMDQGKCFNIGRGLHQHINEYFAESDWAEAEKLLRKVEAKKVTGPQAQMVKRLRLIHDHSLLTFRTFSEKALKDGTKPSTQALIDFRLKNNIHLWMWEEQYFGDCTGVKAKLGPDRWSDPKFKKWREEQKWKVQQEELKKKGWKK